MTITTIRNSADIREKGGKAKARAKVRERARVSLSNTIRENPKGIIKGKAIKRSQFSAFTKGKGISMERQRITINNQRGRES